MPIFNARKIFSLLGLTLLGLNLSPHTTTAVQAAVEISAEQVKSTTSTSPVSNRAPVLTQNSATSSFHVRHNLTIEGGVPNNIQYITFYGRMFCDNYPYSVHPTYQVINITPNQETYSVTAHNIGQQPVYDRCSYEFSANTPPQGYMWEMQNDYLHLTQLKFYDSNVSQTVEHFVTATPHTYEFNWKLVKKPQLINPPQLQVSDPCGPDNATWQNLPQITGLNWETLPNDGSLIAHTKAGYALTTAYSYEYSSIHYYGKPQDSNTPCASIQLKLSGGRFPDTDHQFVMSWQQESPRVPNGAVSARTNIQEDDPTFSVVSGTVATSPNATGTIKIGTRPLASTSREYNADLRCYYTTSAGEQIHVPAARTSDATHFWSLTIPNTGQLTICEANVYPNFAFVDLDLFNGGYSASLTDEVIQQQQPTAGKQNWILYPEGKTPGTVDLTNPDLGLDILSDHLLSFSAKRPGIYYLERVSAPDGYTPDGLQTLDTIDVSKVTINTQGSPKTYFKLRLSPGENRTLQFYSQQRLGNLEFHNVALTPNGALLGGSMWQLSATSGGIYQQHNLADGPLTITDCVAAAASECSGYDVNPEPGKFAIANLEWGDYTLTQTQASPGYKLPDPQLAAQHFTIDHSTLSHSFTEANSLVNEYSEIPSIPHTGGLGRDHLLLSGTFVLLLAGAATVLLQRRVKHQ